MIVKMLPPNQVAEAATAFDNQLLCTGLIVDDRDQSVTLILGDSTTLRVPMDYFEPNAVCGPDFSRPCVTDYGLTIGFGDYEVEVDLVIEDAIAK